MARTRTPQAEGEGRQVEGADFPVEYAELSKPELAEVLENPFEGYRVYSDVTDRKELEAFAESKVAENASIIGTEIWVLWNEETGATYIADRRPAPWQALAQREAGFTRYYGHARQEQGGVIPPGEVTSPYSTIASISIDRDFGWEADYLAARDRLSVPFTTESAGEPDEEFCALVLEAADRKTVKEKSFQDYVLRRPGSGTLGMEDERVSIEPPVELDVPKIPGLSEGPLPGVPVTGNGLGLCKYRGELPSIDGLSGEWVALEFGPRQLDQQAFMEIVAARIGHGARVHVEGVSGQAKVLIPVKFGFAA